MLALSIPFFQAYFQADLFGKAIFLGLFALSTISWIVLIHKIWLTKKMRFFCKGFEKIFQGKENPLSVNLDKAEDLLAANFPNPYFEIYNTLKQRTLEVLDKNRYFASTQTKDKEILLSQADIELINSCLDMTIVNQTKFLEKNLFILPTVVTLAPFLGLLGTVWGILTSFSNMQGGQALAGGNASVLAGLSLALATTVIGLLIAIPALIAYNYLKSSVRDFNKEMESFAHTLLSTIEMQYRRVD